MDGQKFCSKCQQVLPITEFYKHKRDGYQSNCRKCKREYERANNEAHKASDRRWREKNPGKVQEATRLYRQENKAKYFAHSRVSVAVQLGKLAPARSCICVRCGAPAQEYHHADYSKPLDVTPVCSSCHKAIHQVQRTP